MTDVKWVNELWDKVEKKLYNTATRIGAAFPCRSDREGKMIEFGSDMGIGSWTNGFWPGQMWLAYYQTKKELYKKIAIECEDKLDEAFDVFKDLNHDVGFMWIPTSVAHNMIEKNERSYVRAMHAATILAGRFNHDAKLIRAWDFDRPDWAIIDCMMNIPLLFWASENASPYDPRFAQVAKMHADSVCEKFVREDGSVNHVVKFDVNNGDVMDTPLGQGYASGSSWSRGQAWAIYGLVLAYIHTNDMKYLSAAKKVAHYFMMNIDETGIADVDFRAPKSDDLKDSSASAIAACGLIEIARAVPELEKDIYLNAALKLLKGLEKVCNFSDDTDFIIEHCSERYHGGEYGRDVSLVYGDYYFIEALLKLKEDQILFW